MSKIICDVCGTSYPETATQCPICGCVRPADAVVLTTETPATEDTAAGTYTYVKGGRFSKANVRKRLQDGQGFSANMEPVQDNENEPENEKKNTGLVVTVLVLLLAIVAVVIYIAVRFLMPGAPKDPVDTKPSGTVSSTAAATTEATELVIPCTELKLSASVIEMESQNMAQLLNVTKTPADTTDVVTFTSSDENVVTVTSGGKVTAVAPGQAVITITCGNVKAECRVVCKFETVPPTEETTAPTTEPTTAPTETTAPEREFKLNRSDFTLANKGDTWQLYTGSISKSDIKWTTDDPLVATIENGVVTAVGGGKTYVYGEYNGVKEKCIVRCSFAPAQTQPEATEGTEAPTESQPASGKTYTISHTDVTLSVNESFTLTLKDEDGNVVNVTWTSSKSDCHAISGNQITGKKATEYAVVSTVYEGKTYSCIVRVRSN